MARKRRRWGLSTDEGDGRLYLLDGESGPAAVRAPAASVDEGGVTGVPAADQARSLKATPLRANRSLGHCFKGRVGRLWRVDHGLCCNVVPKLRTVIWDFCGQGLPASLHEQLCEAFTDPARSRALRDELGELLHPTEVDSFFTRL